MARLNSQCIRLALVMNIIMAKTGLTAKVNSAKGYIFSNPPKYLPAKIYGHLILLLHNSIILYTPCACLSASEQSEHPATPGTGPDLIADSNGVRHSFRGSNHMCSFADTTHMDNGSINGM